MISAPVRTALLRVVDETAALYQARYPVLTLADAREIAVTAVTAQCLIDAPALGRDLLTALAAG